MARGSSAQPNLYLIGFMAVGKSLIGRWVARRLGLRFLDSDAEIERTAGMTVAEIFVSEGEAAFRDRERAFIEEGHPPSGCVVSCGGGLPIPPGMADRLRARGVVVCLFASAETLYERAMKNTTRPLLAVDDPQQRIRDLLAERLPIYQSIGIGVSAEGRPTREIADNVVRVYRREAAIFATSAARTPTRQ